MILNIATCFRMLSFNGIPGHDYLTQTETYGAIKACKENKTFHDLGHLILTESLSVIMVEQVTSWVSQSGSGITV